MAKMTRADAARILGVPENADKAQINAAARKLIAKYHPDAHRNGTLEEQAQAEKNFKLATQAKKIMLAPPEQERPQPQAQAQPQRQSQQQYRQPATQQQRVQAQNRNNGQARIQDNGNSYSTSARIRQPQQTEPVTRVTSRAGANTARTFHDDIPKIADDQERMIAEMYVKEASEMYSSRDDMLRRTPSMLVSLVFFIYAVARLVIAFQGGGFAELFSQGLPFLAMAAIAIVKFGIYDLIAAYYVKTRMFGQERGWLMLTGVECAITSILLFSVSLGLGVMDPIVLGGLVAAALLISIAMATKRR